MGEVKLDGFICERCEHTWISRNLNNFVEISKPRVCPKCKTPYWNVPRKKVERSKKNAGELKEEHEKNGWGLFPPQKTKKEVLNLFSPK